MHKKRRTSDDDKAHSSLGQFTSYGPNTAVSTDKTLCRLPRNITTARASPAVYRSRQVFSSSIFCGTAGMYSWLGLSPSATTTLSQLSHPGLSEAHLITIARAFSRNGQHHRVLPTLNATGVLSCPLAVGARQASGVQLPPVTTAQLKAVQITATSLVCTADTAPSNRYKKKFHRCI